MTDVCLILEGTYPFVAGGVSTWIHQLISAMPDVRFSILSISPFPNPYREYKYRLPPNVFDIQDIYLHDAKNFGIKSSAQHRRETAEGVENILSRLLDGDLASFEESLKFLRDPQTAMTLADAFESKEAFEVATRLYTKYADDVSFLDYFWTFRSIFLPLANTMRCPIPPARLYHVVSTGYAGLIASVAKLTQDSSMLLTEHGVYTHERLLEISQATWIYTPQKERFRVQQELSYFKRVWLGFFNMLGKLTYHNADKIITLFDGNRVKQIAMGAPPEKISIIPNGIDVEAHRSLVLKPRQVRKKTVAFVGRIVSIKDVKSFIHAAKIVLRRRPETEFLLLGPMDEEPEYYQECRDLVKSLGFGDALRFLGEVNLKEWYSKIDLLVLTSLSEAQPYVIIEANAVGIPVVASDVGACRDLLEGTSDADKVLGASGLLTGVANPADTAAAIDKLLTDADLWHKMSEAGRARVQAHYDQDDLISRYLNLYEHMMR
ncbi:MAG: group 1 glycosyl transferase [Elusimicrobia bacterium]|nr:MAG: group 1 glycosyl transferase [Elusimicrobiota bacterium]